MAITHNYPVPMGKTIKLPLPVIVPAPEPIIKEEIVEKPETKICVQCEDEFTPTGKNQKNCSKCMHHKPRSIKTTATVESPTVPKATKMLDTLNRLDESITFRATAEKLMALAGVDKLLLEYVSFKITIERK